MFVLSGNRVYTWHNLFLILSLERIAPFLDDMKFPLAEHIPEVREVSRTFVKRFYEIELEIFARGEISSVGIHLFDTTYEELSKKVGHKASKIFCQWGNEIEIDNPFGDTHFALWDHILVKFAYGGKNEQVEFPESLQQKSSVLRAIIILNRAELNGFDDALDVLELAPKDEWDFDAYRIYNQGDRRDVSDVQFTLSPLEFFGDIVRYVKIRKTICQITRLLSDSEIYSFLNWIDSYEDARLKVSTRVIFKRC